MSTPRVRGNTRSIPSVKDVMLKKTLLLVLGTVALTAFGACGGEKDAGASTDAPLSIVCKVFERSSLESSRMKGRTLRLGTESTVRDVTIGDFRLRAQYTADEFEGQNLDVLVHPKGVSEPLTQNKYQFDERKHPANQFLGGHGFTGLVYVNHPETKAELQFFCESN